MYFLSFLYAINLKFLFELDQGLSVASNDPSLPLESSSGPNYPLVCGIKAPTSAFTTHANILCVCVCVYVHVCVLPFSKIIEGH